MLARSARYNAAWATIGTASQVAAQTISIVALARLLSPQEFGVVSAATLIIQLLMIFLELGIGAYIVHCDELENSFIGTAFFTSLSLGIIISTLLWLCAPLFAYLLNVPELSIVLKPYTTVFIVSGYVAVHDALIQRNLDFKYLAFADGISYSFGFALISIASALMGFSYWSLVLGHISQSVIRALIIRRQFPQIASYPTNKNDLRTLINFGVGQTLSRLGSYIGSQADGFIVTQQLGVSAIGLYGRANQLVTMPTTQLGQIFDKVLFPMVARTQKDSPRAANTYLSAISGICLLSFPVSVALWIFGAETVKVALGVQWQEVIDPLKILSLAIPFRLIHKVSDPVARAFGETYSRAWRQWLFAIYLIAITLYFCSFGLTAVAWCVVSAAALDALLMMALCSKVTKTNSSILILALMPGLQAGLITGILLSLIKALTQHWKSNDLTILAIAGAVSLAVIATHFYKLRLNARQI